MEYSGGILHPKMKYGNFIEVYNNNTYAHHKIYKTHIACICSGYAGEINQQLLIY